jgi:hypothetical protein
MRKHLKLTERDISASLLIAEWLKEAGLPDGVFNGVHVDKEAVGAILTDPDIVAVSFVGSTPIARYILAEGAALVVSGREFRAAGYENGYCIGGTLFDHVTDIKIGRQEILRYVPLPMCPGRTNFHMAEGEELGSNLLRVAKGSLWGPSGLRGQKPLSAPSIAQQL